MYLCVVNYTPRLRSLPGAAVVSFDLNRAPMLKDARARSVILTGHNALCQRRLLKNVCHEWAPAYH